MLAPASQYRQKRRRFFLFAGAEWNEASSSRAGQSAAMGRPRCSEIIGCFQIIHALKHRNAACDLRVTFRRLFYHLKTVRFGGREEHERHDVRQRNKCCSKMSPHSAQGACPQPQSVYLRFSAYRRAFNFSQRMLRW